MLLCYLQMEFQTFHFSPYKSSDGIHFVIDFTFQILAPCGVNDFVCGRAAEWVNNGTDLCHAAGFQVKLSDNLNVGKQETSCYGDITSLGSVADSWKASQFEMTQKGERLGGFEDFQQWMRGMPFSERVSWAIGGMVLTAGLVFIRSDCSLFCLLQVTSYIVTFMHTLCMFVLPIH